MKYPHLVRYVAEALWAILPERIDGCRHASLEDILGILAFKAAGGQWSAEEIQARIGEALPEQGAQTRNAIAVIPLRGVIANRMGGMEESSGGMSCERFLGMFRQAMATEAVSAILIDCDSPGGVVQGVHEVAAELLAARGQKRIVVQVNALCASAAYWICAAADEIVAVPSAFVGSIGVYTVHEDLSKALEQEGITVTLISAGRHKVEGNPFQPLTEEAKTILQARVDGFYALFARDVANGRGVSPSDVRKGYGEGRALTAKDALAAGLIDRIATMDQTIARLASVRTSRSAMRAEGDVPLVAADGTVANPDLALGRITDGEADADRARRFRVL